MKKHQIAILVGSSRRASTNRRIAHAVAAFTKDVLDCELVEIGNLPLYNQDDEESPAPTVVDFRARIRKMDGILFVTPEYNRGVPGVLKNAIDVGSRPYGKSVWDKKPGAVITAAPGGIGGFGANHQLRQACVFLNMPMMQQPEAYLGRVTDESFDEAGALRPGPLEDLVRQVARSFANWVDVIVRAQRLIAEDPARNPKEQAEERRS